MGKATIAYATTVVVFLGADFIWLSAMGRSFYRAHLDHLMAEKPILWAAGIFYVIYSVGVLLLVLRPALASESVQQALVTGAILGLVAYATYDLTNQATLRDWPLLVTAVDLLWGTVLTGVASAIGVWVAGKVS